MPTPEAQAVDEAQATADAQAAFEQVSSDAKPAEAKPETKPEPKAEPNAEKKDEVKPDPKAVEEAVAKSQREAAAKAATEKEWEGVPSKVRQELEAISGKIGGLEKIEHRLKGVEGRTGAALDGVHALKTALEAAKAAKGAGAEAPTQGQIAAAVSSTEKWKQIKEDYPDWAEAMEEQLAAMGKGGSVDLTAIKAEVTGSVSEIVAQATSAAKAEARELARIDRVHDDWEQTINTPEFADWRKAQPPEVQALGASEKAGDAIKMLDAYKAHREAVAEATAKAERDRKRLGGAIQPKGTAAPAARNVSDEAAAQQGFNSAFT